MSRDTILTSLATVVTGAVAALYGLLIARFFAGQPAVSDAFFQAYAVFATLGSFSITMRISVPPILVATRETETGGSSGYGQAAVAVCVFFAILAAGIGAASGKLGAILGYGLEPEGRRLTGTILLAFAPAIFLQAIAQFLSAALGVAGKFAFISLVSIVASLLGLAVFVFTSNKGVLSTVLGLSVFNFLYAAAQWLRARAMGLRVRPDDWGQTPAATMGRTLAGVFSCSSVYLGLNLAYPVSQSLASSFAAGVPTAFAYAYTLTATAGAVTAGAMGITLAARYSQLALATERRDEFRDFVVEHTVMGSLLVCGLLGLLCALARPLGLFLFSALPAGGGMFPSKGEAAAILARFVWALAAGCWSLGLFSVLAPATIAAKLNQRFVAFTAFALLAHFVVSVALKRALGPAGIGLGFSLTALLFALFQAARLSRLFGAAFLKDVARRSLAVTAIAGLSAACTSIIVQCFLKSAGLPASFVTGGVLFCALYVPGAALLEKRTTLALLSHFRK